MQLGLLERRLQPTSLAPNYAELPCRALLYMHPGEVNLDLPAYTALIEPGRANTNTLIREPETLIDEKDSTNLSTLLRQMTHTAVAIWAAWHYFE